MTICQGWALLEAFQSKVFVPQEVQKAKVSALCMSKQQYDRLAAAQKEAYGVVEDGYFWGARIHIREDLKENQVEVHPEAPNGLFEPFTVEL